MPRPKKAKPDASSGPRIARCLIRVSDVGGRDDEATMSRSGSEFISPEQQMETARVWCKLHNVVLDEEASLRLMDLNRSAFRLHWSKRAGLVQHIKDAQAGLFHTLIVYKISRLARNTLEGLEVWKIFEDAEVDIVSPTDNIDTSTSSGKMLRTMLLGFAQMQSEDMSQYASDMHRLRAKKGKGPSSVPSWLDRNEDGDYVINEQEAAPLRRMVELRLQRKSIAEIGRTLNVEKLFRKPLPNRFRGEAARLRPWAHNRIMFEFAQSDRFIGTATYRLMNGDVYKIPDAYPPLITRDEHEALVAVNESLRPVQSASEKGRRRGAAIATPYLLSSRVFCGVCEARLETHSGKAAQSRNYGCKLSRFDAARHPNGKSVSLSADILEDAVARVVRFALACHPVAPPPPRTPTVQNKSGRRVPEDEIGAIRSDMSLLLDLLMEKQITRELYKERFEPLKIKMVEWEAIQEKDKEEKAGESDENGKNGAAAETDLAYAAAAQAAAADAALTNDWRTVFLHTLSRVDAPVFLPNVTYIRGGSRPSALPDKPRRCARITLRWCIELPSGETAGPVFYSPIYLNRFMGERELYNENGEKLVLS